MVLVVLGNIDSTFPMTFLPNQRCPRTEAKTSSRTWRTKQRLSTTVHQRKVPTRSIISATTTRTSLWPWYLFLGQRVPGNRCSTPSITQTRTRSKNTAKVALTTRLLFHFFSVLGSLEIFPFRLRFAMLLLLATQCETAAAVPTETLSAHWIPSFFQTSFWRESYTADDAWLPLILPFLLWSSCWVSSRLIKKTDFAKWYSLHTLHHVGAISQASLSLWYGNNAIFHERIPILWSMSYFVMDIVDCLYAGHVLYIAHGAICLCLGLANYHIPLLKTLRMNSKATYIETSSILLYQVKQHRQPWLFLIFAITYTCCRIVWIPCMMKELLENGMDYTDLIFVLLVLFYLLQIHWWIKILRILITGGGGDEKGDGHRKEESGTAETKTKKDV
jgi:hypothetical protein